MDAIKLIVSIVERGKGVAMQRLYDQRQVFLHLQCAGRGTATSEILDILGLGSSEKDVVFSFAAAPSAQLLLHDLDNDLRGSVDTSGIVFSLPDRAEQSGRRPGGFPGRHRQKRKRRGCFHGTLC